MHLPNKEKKVTYEAHLAHSAVISFPGKVVD